MSIKLSCLPVSIFPDIISEKVSIGNWAAIGKEIGLDAIDLSVLFFKNRTPRYLADLKKQIQAQEIDVMMLTTYPDFTNPDKLQRDRELAYCQSDIALASEFGIKYLRITAGQRRLGTNIYEMAKLVADYFRKCEETANQFGIGLVYENHAKPGAWDDYDFTFEKEAFLALNKELSGTNVKVNFDMANMVAFGEKPQPVFSQVFESIETIHISDTTSYGEFQSVEIGKGSVPIEEVLSLAVKNGFCGWTSIEEASGTGIEGIKNSVVFIRDVLERIEIK